MGTHQFFVQQSDNREPTLGALIPLSKEDSHHARQVLRLQDGVDVRVVFRETGDAYTGALRLSQQDVLIELKNKLSDSLETSLPPVHSIVFGLSKGKKNDLIIEKSTELGVEHIVLCQTAHSVAKIRDEQDLIAKQERFSKIAETAAKQSKRRSIPRVSLITSLSQLSPHLGETPGPRYLCSLSIEATHISKLPLGATDSLILAVGPEGDFNAEEELWFQNNDFQLVSLGENILRSETAAIASIAMVRALRDL